MAPRLNGRELGELRDALVEAFSEDRFEELLRFRLDKIYATFVARNDTYNRAVFRVLDNANQTLWWRDLLRAARAAVPGDPILQDLAGRFDAAPLTVGTNGDAVGGRDLELKIIDSQSTFDIGTWRRRLGEIEGRVCRVEYPPTVARGTGSLIGPNTVLTNYHVVRKVIKDDYLPSSIRLRFDYLVGPDGVQIGPGTAYELAADWAVTESEYSPMDELSQPPADPEPHHLDFAVLRTAVAVGNEPVGGPTDDPEPSERGWIEPAAEAYPFDAGTALYIVQHPDGAPMQVAVDSSGVLGQNGNHTPSPLHHDHAAGLVRLAVLQRRLAAGRAAPQRRPEVRRDQARRLQPGHPNDGNSCPARRSRARRCLRLGDLRKLESGRWRSHTRRR